MGVSKSFGTNITENHLDNLSALFFGQALDQMGQKCRYLAQNDQKCIFCTNFGCFWATENHQDNLSALFFGQALDQMVQKC